MAAASPYRPFPSSAGSFTVDTINEHARHTDHRSHERAVEDDHDAGRCAMPDTGKSGLKGKGGTKLAADKQAGGGKGGR
jgi:hypothetical protein